MQLDGILLADLSTPACGSAANEAFLVEGRTRRLLPTFVLQENQIEGVQFTVRTIEPALWLDQAEGAAAAAAVG